MENVLSENNNLSFKIGNVMTFVLVFKIKTFLKKIYSVWLKSIGFGNVKNNHFISEIRSNLRRKIYIPIFFLILNLYLFSRKWLKYTFEGIFLSINETYASSLLRQSASICSFSRFGALLKYRSCLNGNIINKLELFFEKFSIINSKYLHRVFCIH